MARHAAPPTATAYVSHRAQRGDGLSPRSLTRTAAIAIDETIESSKPTFSNDAPIAAPIAPTVMIAVDVHSNLPASVDDWRAKSTVQRWSEVGIGLFGRCGAFFSGRVTRRSY